MMGISEQHQSLYETVTCNLCGADDYVLKYEPTREDFNPLQVFSASGGIMGTQYIVQCRQCGLMYVNPRLKPEVVIKAYQDTPDDLYLSQAEGRERTFLKCLRMVEQCAPSRGKMLDVGAAGGFFLKVAKENGWQTYGVEPSKWLCEYGRKQFDLDITQGTLHEAAYPNNYFDVVTVWDVLEHVPDPNAELREIYRVLKPGGTLVVNYPDAGTPMAKLAGGKWWFFLSVHLYYFDSKTIRKLLNKVGFEAFQAKMHFQTLDLGHLTKMVGLYNQTISKLMERIVSNMGLNRTQVPYYASQTTVTVKKPL